MNKQEHINYWHENSENDWLSALEIATKNDRKQMALFKQDTRNIRMIFTSVVQKNLWI